MLRRQLGLPTRYKTFLNRLIHEAYSSKGKKYNKVSFTRPI
jgi:hypothetical protein